MKHDMNYYMKGIFLSRLQLDSAAEVLQAVAELGPKTGADMMFAYELFPTEKALSFPRDSTAFLRWPGISCVIFGQWVGDDSQEKLEAVKSAIYKIAGIVDRAEDTFVSSENTGYGNYSKQSSIFLVPPELTAISVDEENVTDKDGQTKKQYRTAALFGDHYPRLQALKKKYDPDMVFNRWNPITPA